jgi:dTDP-4-dehydrorhamnose reductase
MAKLLITGASGFLGWTLCQVAQQQGWQVIGTRFSHPLSLPEIESHAIDLCNADAVSKLMDRVQPDAIIHTAAQTRAAICQQQPEQTYPINVRSPEILATLCAQAQIPLVFTSTDLVFDGTHAPYDETAPVSPINVYGAQKAEAEQRLFAAYSQAAIARMPLMFGAAPPHASSFIQSFLATLRAGKTLNLFTDEHRTPVSSRAAASGLLLALAQGQGQILNLGGKERLSRYDFGVQMAEVFEISLDLLHPCSQSSLNVGAPRAPDTSLNSSKAFALGYAPPSVREELEFLKGVI